ncbi:MAG TPA: hypothetical protein VF997_18830, partial [Polyangia bacterium]
MRSAASALALLAALTGPLAASGCVGANPDATPDGHPMVLLDSGTPDDMPDGGTSDLSTPRDLALPSNCPTAPLPDPHASERAACAFSAGARVADTLGLTAAA